MQRLDCYLNLARDNYKQKCAIIEKGQGTTYQELYDKVNQVAYFLNKHKIVKGKRVIINLENSIEQIVSFFACLRVGAVPVIVNPEIPLTVLNYILLDLAPEAAFFELKSLKIFKQKVSYQIIVNTQNQIENSFSYESITSGTIQEEIIHPIISVDLACIIYTSGSTGLPKGVMLSHRNMLTAAQSINEYLQYRADDIILNVLPLSFDYGLYQVILSVISGATLILEKSFIWPPLLFKIIKQYKVTVLPLVATMIPSLLKSFKGQPIGYVKKITNTGTRMTSSHISALKEMFNRAAIYSMYGLTECKRCSYIPPSELSRKKDSIGISIPNLEMKIVDKKGALLPPYTHGEIIIRSDTVMLGYWNNKIATNKKIKTGSWIGDRILYTGDIGYYDNDGYFYLTGREDDTVKIRGFKVNLSYVERIIEQCHLVSSVSIIVVHNKSQIERLVAFVIFNKNSIKNKEELINFCKIRLSKIETTEYILEINEFPRNIRGKIDKNALEILYNLTKEELCPTK